MPMGANKYSSCIKWTMLELKGLLEDEDAHVTFQRSKRHIALHPFQVNDMNRALRENLSSKVNFYDHDLQGLVLAYKRQKLLDSLADILHDAPFIHINMEADFYIFRPTIGCTLKGIANKKAGNHLGVLVHKAFNVSIIKEDDCEEWLGDFVYVGQELKFTVTHLDFKGKLPFIRGKLIADETMGQVYYDTINTDEVEKKPVVEDGSLPSGQKRKSKKSHAVSSTENEEVDDSVSRGVNGELSDTEESSPNREKIKKGNSSKNKSPSCKKAAVETESSSEDEKPNPKKVVNKTTNGGNSKSDSEDSSDHERTKRSIFNRKQQIAEQNRGKNLSIDSESSDDDRGSTSHGSNVKKSVSSPAKNKLDYHKVGRNKSSSIDSDSSVEEKPRLVESAASSKPRTSNGASTSPTKRSKKNHVEDAEEDAMSEMDVKPGAKVKKRKKKDENEKIETGESNESPGKSNAHEIEGRKVKNEEEEREKKRKKSKVQEDAEIQLKNEEEEEERKKKKSKAHQDEGRKLKNEEEEEERKKKKSKAHQDEGRKLKNEEEEEERKKKKPKAHQDEGRKLKNEDEEEERRKRKSKVGDAEADEAELENESVKMKSKKKYKVEGEIVKDGEPSASGFEFVKPDLDAFDHPVSKSKRKRRKTITQEEEEGEESSDVPTSDYSEDFFRDVRVKIEPDPSDVEDSMPIRKERKRKRKHSEGEVVKKRVNIFSDIEIKQELMSDVEDIKSNVKKSKIKHHEPNSPKTVRVKMERETPDVESPSKRKIKREPEESSKRPAA